jgi:hypothetical protein
MTKDVGLRLRVERVLRDRFVEVCRAEDRPAAQVLREFMRRYVAKHQGERTPSGELSAQGTTKTPPRAEEGCPIPSRENTKVGSE